MAPQRPRKALALLTVLLSTTSQVTSIQVTPNSPCSSTCIDVPTGDVTNRNSSNTQNSDITCEDRLYGSAVGEKWQKCMTCLQNSTFVNRNENDQSWFLYNMRYGLSNCIFNFPNATGMGNTPCMTSTACGPLEEAFEVDILSPGTSSQYSYCSANGEAMTGLNFNKCVACMNATGETNILSNYILALGAGCKQQPSPGKLIGLSGSVFSPTRVEAVDPSATPSPSGGGGLPASTVAIIAVAIFVVIAIIGAIFCCRWRRRRRMARGFHPAPEKGSFRRWTLSGHRPRSDQLSFQCRADMLSPTFTPGNGGPGLTLEEMSLAYQRRGDPAALAGNPSLWRPYNVGAPTNGHSAVSPVAEEPPYYYDLQPQEVQGIDSKPPLKENGKGSLGYNSAVPLHTLKTSIPPAPAHVYSPPSAISRSSPISASSVRSTASLLPRMAPYKPSGGDPAVFGSPSSAGTNSPLVRNPSNYEWLGTPPQTEEQRGKGAPGLTSGPRPGLTSVVPPTPPPKSPRHLRSEGSQPRKARTRQESGSPSDSKPIQTSFPAPPRR